MKVRRKQGKTFTHYTRHMPKRAAEVLDGGSLYWIVKGYAAVRCPIVGLEDAILENKGPHCGIVMKTELIQVVPQPRRPHQGWRYLEAEDAPADRKEEQTSELQSLMRISYDVFCLNKKNKQNKHI